jgi:hypothetical protein
MRRFSLMLVRATCTAAASGNAKDECVHPLGSAIGIIGEDLVTMACLGTSHATELEEI